MTSLVLAYLIAMLMLLAVGLLTWRTSTARRRRDVHAPGAPFHDAPPHVHRVERVVGDWPRRRAPFDQDSE
jgi:hypothetical protein